MSPGATPIRALLRDRLNGIGFGVALVVALLAMPSRAFAQADPATRVIFVENGAYRAGAPTLLVPALAGIYPDPRGRYALIWHVDLVQQPSGSLMETVLHSANEGVASLQVYDSHSNRTRMLWIDEPQHLREPADLVWLSGADSAIVTIKDREPIVLDKDGFGANKAEPAKRSSGYDLCLYRSNSTAAPCRMLLHGDSSCWIRPSPKLPIAVIEEHSDASNDGASSGSTSRFFTVDARGDVGLSIDIDPSFHGTDSWTADGTTTYFYKDTYSPGAETPTQEFYSFNVATKALIKVDKVPDDAAAAGENSTGTEIRLDKGDATLTAPIVQSAKFPITKPVKLSPLQLVRADGKHEASLPDSLLIAAHADDGFLLADDSAILYSSGFAVYAIPLTREARPAALASYHLLLKNETIENARKIGAALVRYAESHDGAFPGAEGIETALDLTNRATIFKNVATGMPAFTYRGAGLQNSYLSAPIATVAGVLAGDGGRAVIYADGHVAWEDSH